MASPLTQALLEQLVRNGVLDADDIGDMADRLDAAGHGDDAYIARVALISAAAPSQSDWEAERRRSRLHVVPDGGNDAA